MATPSSPSSPSSLPSPPFIPVPGVPNFRDLGGDPNTPLRPSIIYRCGDPSRVTADGISKLQSLGITHVYDLRSLPEIRRSEAAGRGSPVEWEGCERVFTPVYREEDYSPEEIARRYADYASASTEGFVQAYKEILKAGPAAYKTIFLHLANKPEKPLIVHCTAGKDRTGVLCALILSLCGIDDETVGSEYELTEVGLSREWKTAVVEHLVADPALKGDREGAWRMIGSRKESMLETLKLIREKYGGAEGYVRNQCGLTADEVAQIKKNLTVKD